MDMLNLGGLAKHALEEALRERGHGQRRRNVSVQALWNERAHGRWEEIVVEDRSVSPADMASFKIDFADWLKRLKRSKRRVDLRLASGDTPRDAALRFRLTRSRISQLRNELRQNGAEFQGEPEEQGARCGLAC